MSEHSQSRSQLMSTPSTEANQCLADGEVDYGSNSLQSSMLADQEEGADPGRYSEAVEDLGEVRDLSSGFTSAAGRITELLCPNVGDKGKAQINLNVPVDQTGTVKVAFQFVTEIERDANGIKGKFQVSGGVLLSKTIDLYLATADAFAQARVFGYAESYGDSGAEMFGLMSMGLQQRVDGVSSSIANAIWNRDYIDSTMGGMDNDDYIETGMGIEGSAGMGVRTLANEPGEHEALAVGSIAGSQGTRLTTDGDGGVEAEGRRKVEVGIGGNASPFAVQGKVAATWAEDRGQHQLQELEGEVAGEAMIAGSDLSELVMGGRWLSGVVGNVSGLISGGAGMLDGDDVGRQAASIASFMTQGSALGTLAEGGAARALDRLSGMGVSVGHKLTVKGVWKRGQGPGLEVTFERVNNIEFGGSPRDMVYVLLENIDPVLSVKLGSA